MKRKWLGRPRQESYSENKTYIQAISGAVLNRLNNHYGRPDLSWSKLIGLCIEELEAKEFYIEELEERTRREQ